MGILGSVSRYLKTYGRLLYADRLGFLQPLVPSRKKKSARAAYMEMLEPRVLMTTVFGGDVFQYTDALGNTVTASLNGNVIAELVSAVQVGGTSGQNVTSTGGYLMFGDIAGTYTSGPHAGVVLGNGSLPVDNGTQGSAVTGNANAHILIPGDSYPDPQNGLPGNQVNLSTLSTDAAGQTYTFNIFDVQNNGSLTISPLDTTSQSRDFTMQVIQLDNTSMAGTVVYTVDSDTLGTLLPMQGSPLPLNAPGAPFSDTQSTFTYAEVGIKAAAFNPLDNKLYFELHYTINISAGGGGGGGTTRPTNVDEIYSFDPANTSGGFTDIGSIDAVVNAQGVARQAVTGMAFTLNAADPTTATLFISQEPTAAGLAGRPVQVVRMLTFDVATDGSFDPTVAVSTFNLDEGYSASNTRAAVANQITGIVGLTVLPGSQDGGGDGFLFAVVSNGASSHLTRIDLAPVNGTANGTAWGSTTDLYEVNARTPRAPFDGRSLTGLTYNPTLVDPFTGQLGVFLSIDTATTNLDFINHKLRIDAGDVYAVYSATSDINASIVFQGNSFYSGASGALGATPTPGNTGTVFIGYKGQLPDNTTNGTFAGGSPFLTGQITGSLGVMPGLIQDTTDPTVAGAPTDKLFAGLDVAKTLEQTFNATASILTQVLGAAFNNVTGLAISPDQQIAVVNSFYYNGAAGDQLAFVNATTGSIDAASTIYNVVLNGVFTPLKNLQALAYGDPNLDGTSELYAVYDLNDGNGPTLGTLTIDPIFGEADFTPIQALGLGAHGRVSAIAFSPGGSAGDPTHQSLYVVADPKLGDFDGNQYLYKANLTFTPPNVTGAVVANAPTYDAGGNVLTSGGIGPIVDSTGRALKVVSMTFDANGGPLVLDRLTGRLEDVNLASGVAGVNVATGVGEINPTVAGVALDPVSLKLFVVDNVTGITAAETNTGPGYVAITASAIMMQLKDFVGANVGSVNLGKFMVDGTISGKITVPGAMNMLYAGWLMTGDSTINASGAAGSWIVPGTATWAGGAAGSTTPLSDDTTNENYFRNNIFVAGDLRNVVVLTSIGTNGILPTNAANEVTNHLPPGLTGVEITALGKIGEVFAKGTIAGVVHAGNQTFVPGLVDATPLFFQTTTDVYGYTFRGSATGSTGIMSLTSGIAAQAGSAFSNNLQPIDSFTASFTSSALPIINGTSTGFDGGYAFVVQNQGLPALGSTGAGLGYSGIVHSAGLGFFFDPITDNVSLRLMTNGVAVGPATLLGGFSGTTSGNTLNVTLTYSGSTLLVNLTSDLGINFTANYTVNLAAILGSHAGYVGFTAATGTQGSTTQVSNFIFNGSSPIASNTQLVQTDIQHYNVDTDFSFAAGYLTANGTNAPFGNISFQTAQYLGAVRNAAAGQSDTIHLAGVLEGTTPTNPPPTINQRVDYYSFSLLAGQTVDVSVVPRTEQDPNITSGTADTMNFAIYDPDGNQIATDLNWKNSTETLARTIRFTADRPGAYRVAISENTTFTDAGSNPGNINYDLTIKNAGNMGIGAVAAGGQLVLTGSNWIINSTLNTGSTIINPSIWADSGDVGLIQAGATGSGATVRQSIVSNIFSSGLSTLNDSLGYSYTGTSSKDVFVASGNLRAMVGGEIGAYYVVNGVINIAGNFDVSVSGNVGLLQSAAGSPILYCTFSQAAGGNIQVVSAGGMLYSTLRANQAIGVIRAGSEGLSADDNSTVIQVDADRTGADGVIDLIDVTGVWNGAPIISGPGGNVRFMRVGGMLYQDPLFETTGNPSNNGGIVHDPGPYTFTDDSGAVITLTPTTLTNVSTTGTVTTVGVLTTRTYGVRGAGGLVLVDVSSTTGLNVSVAPGGTGRNIGDIGTIIVNGSGTNLSLASGFPALASTTGAMTDVTLSTSGNAKINVLAVTAPNTSPTGITIDHITNTNGDILSVNASDVGFITVNGNLGTTALGIAGEALVPTGAAFGGGTFPFDGRAAFGVNASSIGFISATQAVGNVLSSGVVGTITADSGGSRDPSGFEGITGLIVVNGTANATSSITTTVNGVATTTTLTTVVSLGTVNIGQGIAFQSSAETPLTGIYTVGKLMQVLGTNADIRGNVVSTSLIGTVSLTNGSIINSQIDVYTSWQMVESTFNGLAITLPNPTTNIDQPQYVIDLVSIQGTGGGILGSNISGSSINNVIVGPGGFGIINTDITGVDVGTIHSITAGGYGIIRGTIFDARVLGLSATGSGAPLALSSLAAGLRTSDHSIMDSITGATPNNLTDLSVFFLGDGQPYAPTPWGNQPVWWGLATGVLGDLHVFGKDNLGNLSAYDIRDSKFNFPGTTGTITVRHIVDDTELITGRLAGLSIVGDATNLEVSVAGQIGPVSIGGNFEAGTNSLVSTLSQIIAKGANGNITSFVNKGNFGGLLLAEGSLGSVVIGTAGAKGVAGTGDLTGTVTVGSNHLASTSLNSLKIFGSVLAGAVIDLSGNIGTIDIGQNVSNLANNIIVRGNVASLLVGTDTVVSGSDLGNVFSITGNLANAVITGSLSGKLIVLGNLGKFALNPDPVTAGPSLLTGAVSVGGTLTSATVQGGVVGNIVAGILNAVTVNGDLAGNLIGGESLATATILGNVLAGASVSSSLGDIKKLTVKGDINGSIRTPNGTIVALSFTGAIGATGVITAESLGAISVPGAIAGSITTRDALKSITAGSLASTARITAGSLASLTTKGDMNGVLNIGDTSAIKIAVGANFGGQVNVAAPLTMTVGGNMVAGASIIDSNALTSLAVKGSLAGTIIVDQLVKTITAGSMANAVITAGQGLATLKVTGAMSNSLVQSGISRGIDNVFGTNDLNEQGRMGDLGSLAVGSMSNSIVAAGGNIGTFTATGLMTDSSVSSGLVVAGSGIAAVMADATPLATAGELNAARQGATLLHGSIKSATVGKTGTTLVNSAITAGVSPGADGVFGTADDNVNTSLTGGVSSITAFKGVLDGTSHLMANTPAKALPGLTLVTYTTDASPASIVQADPISGVPTLVVTPTTPGTLTTASGTIVVKVTGPAGTTVSLYDNATTTDRLDTLLISGTASGAVNVTVTTSNPAAFNLGRVIASDNTQVSSFTFNGDILGDVSGGPSLWIDSDMSSFTVRNLPNDGTWNGLIGGNVSKLTLNQLGPGKFRIGGRITTLNVASSVGNPLLQQLGLVTPATIIQQIAYDSSSGNVFASDGLNLLNVNINTGTVNSSSPFHTLLTNATVNVSGLAFDAAGNLFGVATLNNQNPVHQVGQISTTGDTLHGLAVSPAGTIYAIDSQSGIDKLVTIDPVTGARAFAGSANNAGVIRDSHANTFSGNITALAFDAGGNLLALTNDRDGGGGVNSTANGYALGKLTISANGSIRISSPTGLGAAGDPILLNGTITDSLTAMAITQTGGIYVVENVGAGVQRLDTLTIGVGANPLTLTTVGNIMLGAANTSLVGIGVDERGRLIGMNLNGSNSELVGISTADPTLSVRLDAPGLISGNLGGFAIGKSGANYTAYGYTTNATTGGMFFDSPGLTPTLGAIATDGGFTQLLPLASDARGTPLAGNVTGVAVDSTGNIFAISDQGVLAEYSSADGSIIGGQPIGVVKDAFGAALQITRIAFNASGELIGLSANGNNLVKLGQTTTVLNGENISLAGNVTELGTADAADLTALSFATGLNAVLSYSTASGRFVNLLATTPGSIGGIVANTFGSVSLPAAFSGHLGATGGGGVSANGVDSIKFTGAGTFTGNITTVNSIGTVAGTGITMAGAIVSHADIKSISLTGPVGRSAVISADGQLATFTLTGDFDGRLLAHSGTTFSIKGAVLPEALIAVVDNLATLTVTGNDSGLITLGSNKTLTVSGLLASGAVVDIAGLAGNITLNGGVQAGGLLLAQGAATSIKVGGTLAGIVGTRKSVATVTLATVNAGILAVGGDLKTLSVTGNVSNSILAAGLWIGADGTYNTADDVIFGGTIATAKIGGVFTDSAITAGILPPEGTGALANNVPAKFDVFDYNIGALTPAEIDAAESGGIGLSYINNVTFSKPVVSSNPGTGLFSALVAANGIGQVSTSANTAALRKIVRSDTPGAPAIVPTLDPLTQLPVQALRFAPGEIRITFNEALDTATLNATTIQVVDEATNLPVTDLTFGYFRQTAEDGSIQSVLQIFSASHFNNNTSLLQGLVVTLAGGPVAPTITDITGTRSSLLDYNQDGVVELDPFGTTFAGAVLYVGAPSNDNIANAIVITSTNITLHAANINATAEIGEPAHGNFAASSSVWWTWTAPSNGAIAFDTVGSNFNTTLSVYSGTTSAFAFLTRVKDSSDGSNSRVQFVTTAGTTYYIAIDSIDQTGNITLNVSVPPPPANDNFSSAQTMTGFPTVVTGSNFLATAEVGEPTHGGDPATSSVWYKWTAPSTEPVAVTALGSNFAAVVSVYTGSSLATLSPITLGSSGATLDTFDKPADLLVYTPVASALGTPLTTTTATISTAVAHDGPSSLVLNGDEWLFRTDPAARIEQGTTVSAWVQEAGSGGRTYIGFGASDTGGLSMVMGDNTSTLILQNNALGFGFTDLASSPQVWVPGKWYRFEIVWATGGAITGNLYDSDGTTLINTVSAVDNTVKAGGIALRGFGRNSFVDTITTSTGGAFNTFNAVAGTTYYMAVDGLAGDTGNVTLSILPVVAPNDSFASATALVGLPVDVTSFNTGATREAGEPLHASVASNTSVWWNWTPTVTGVVTISTEGSNFDTVLGVYTGTSVDTLTPVVTNDDAVGLTSKVTFTATAGVTYRIAVSGFEDSVGTIHLTFT